MKELTKKEIVDVMIKVAHFQAEVYDLYNPSIINVTKYKSSFNISVHYNPCEVTYEQIFSLFRYYFSDFKEFIYTIGCYSSSLSDSERAAHFELKFYA